MAVPPPGPPVGRAIGLDAARAASTSYRSRLRRSGDFSTFCRACRLLSGVIVRVTLVHNAVAGDDDQPNADELTALIRSAGHDVAYHAYKDPSWDEALNDPGDLVAVAGGDGTSARVAKRMIDRGVPLTFLPLGTANNISKSLGLAHLKPRDLVAGWKSARHSKLDVGVFEAPSGTKYFLEGAGMGLFARTMIEIDAANALDHLATGGEKVAHALRLMGERLSRFAARSLKLELDGRDLSGDYLMIEAMNMQFVGPNLHLVPDCDPTDGRLDVVLVGESEREELRRYLSRASGEDARPPRFTIHRGEHLTIAWQGEMMHVDDRAWPSADIDEAAGHTIHLRVKSEALDVLLPRV